MKWVTQMSGSSTTDGSAALRSACGDYDVFAQIDYEPNGACLFPQMYFLQTLLRYLPSACFILNTRPTEHWLESVRNWNDMLPHMISSCPINPRNATGLGEWYDRFKARASLALCARRLAALWSLYVTQRARTPAEGPSRGLLYPHVRALHALDRTLKTVSVPPHIWTSSSR